MMPQLRYDIDDHQETPVMYGRKKGSGAAVVLSGMVLDGCRTENLVGGDGVLMDEDDS